MDWLDELFDENSVEQEASMVSEEAIPEYDAVAEEMFEQQRAYEEELMGYPDDSPYRIFAHSFLHAGYLDCKTITHPKVEFDQDKAVIRFVEEAYDQYQSGKKSLNHIKFCKIWNELFEYEYCGYMLTPDGQMDVDTFKAQIVQMLFLMEVDNKNLDLTATHLYNTYISAYRRDAYKVTNMIPFRNGDLYLNEDGKSFTFHLNQKSPVPYRFDYDFHNIDNCVEPYFPWFKKWRDDLFDEDDVFTLKQLLGYLLIPSNEAQEAFFIIGKAGSGKSILTDCILPRMLGDALFPVSIGQFFNDKFQIGTSEGKLCMVDDDIGEARLSYEDSGRFKNFVTASTIKIEHKHCNPTKIANSARIVCAGNHMINSDDKTDGFTRRLHPIYVKPRSIEKVDPKLPRKIAGEIEMIVLWALEGLTELASNGGVPYSSNKTENRFRYYAEGQKWEEQFIMDTFCFDEDAVSYSPDIKDALAAWLKENSEVCGDVGNITGRMIAVTKWLKDEGADKYGYVYKRGLKRGDSYNARGFLHMKFKAPITNPIVFRDEKGSLKIKVGKRNPNED